MTGIDENIESATQSMISETSSLKTDLTGSFNEFLTDFSDVSTDDKNLGKYIDVSTDLVELSTTSYVSVSSDILTATSLVGLSSSTESTTASTTTHEPTTVPTTSKIFDESDVSQCSESTIDTTIHPKYQVSKEKYIMGIYADGPNNQFWGFRDMLALSIYLNRTVILSPFISPWKLWPNSSFFCNFGLF